MLFRRTRSKADVKNPGTRRVVPVTDPVSHAPRVTLTPRHMNACRWNRILADRTTFHSAIQSLTRIYKETQNIDTMSHVDAHRLSDHIYMRILVNEGLMSEAEYEQWEGGVDGR